MKYFIALTFCSAFTILLPAQQAFLDEFQQKWKNAEAYTLESIELMPEEALDYKPTEEQRSFRDQIIHSCRNMIWLSSSYLGGDKSGIDVNQKGLTKADLIDLVKTCFQRSGEAAANLKPDDLEEKVSFFAGPMSKRQILVLMNDHSTHHRAQMLVYLRLKGLTPPKYRGW
ncbi:MAG: DinB family protein [Saprospiraceae bacterium]|nr:DinB family protein [Saprospiraceae bacterium]